MMSNHKAETDAAATTDQYLVEAIKSIDQRLGEGYAKKNPQLVAAFITVSAMVSKDDVANSEGRRK